MMDVVKSIAWKVALPLVLGLLARLAWLNRKGKNRVTFNSTSPITRKIVQSIRNAVERYDSIVWLPTGILQTAWTEVATIPKVKLARDTLNLDALHDETGTVDHKVCRPKTIPPGQVSVDFFTGFDDDMEENLPTDAPVVVLVPGLTGDSGSGYIRRIAKYLASGESGRRYRVCCYNPRGRGGNDLKTPMLYCVGYTVDLKRAIAHIKSKYPNSDLFAAGFSLGSNYLAKFVGEEGGDCPLKAAACLACPVDCLSISNMLQGTFVGRTIFDPILVASVQKVRAEYEHLLAQDERFDMDKIKAAKTMHEFDGQVIAKMFEFSSASAYYRWSSSGLVLDQIRRPTMFVHAENDPIVNASSIKMDDFAESPWLINVMTREGGHGMDWFRADGKPWIGHAIGQFFAAAADTASDAGVLSGNKKDL